MTRIAANKPNAALNVPRPSLPPKGKPVKQPFVNPGRPNVELIKHHRHNLEVARNLKGNIQDVLARVRFGPPLGKGQTPYVGKNGQLVAPNGDPLIRVKLSDGNGVPGSSQYALVNPKSNEFYLQTNGGGFTHPTSYNGPVSLPKGSRFHGDKFTPADLKRFEQLANAQKPTAPLSLKDVLKKLEAGAIEFGAEKPTNAGTEKILKSEHPFTYYVVTLKDDPKHVVIKKVLTGGFVPAKPGDGSYSEPIAIG